MKTETRRQEKARNLIRRMDELVLNNRKLTPEEENEMADIEMQMRRLHRQAVKATFNPVAEAPEVRNGAIHVCEICFPGASVFKAYPKLPDITIIHGLCPKCRRERFLADD